MRTRRSPPPAAVAAAAAREKKDDDKKVEGERESEPASALDAQRRQLAERERELQAVLALRDESEAVVQHLQRLLREFAQTRDDAAAAADVCAGWPAALRYAAEAAHGGRLVAKPLRAGRGATDASAAATSGGRSAENALHASGA